MINGCSNYQVADDPRLGRQNPNTSRSRSAQQVKVYTRVPQPGTQVNSEREALRA